MPPFSARTRRPRTRLAIVACLAVLVAWEVWWRPARTAATLPTGEARWIWSAEDPGVGLTTSKWRNVFLYRDFEVTPPGGAGAAPVAALLSNPADPSILASLRVKADEAYWAYLNGRPIGSGVYREGSPVDLYDLTGRLAELVRPGPNRLALEVRSRRGVGGALVQLQLGREGESGFTEIVSDGTWRATDRYVPGLLEPGVEPEEALPVRVWGLPPVGRWGLPRELVRVSGLDEQLAAGAGSGTAAVVDRLRPLDQDKWTRAFSPPEHRVPLGRWVFFDFGRTVHGYLNVVLAERAGARLLIYPGLDRTYEPGTAEPAAFGAVPVGRGSWTDVSPRSFRFVTVLATAEVSGVRAYEVDPTWVASLRDDVAIESTAFGIEPPSSPSVEDEFWSELERITGVRGREAFESRLGG